jgi:predicted ATPase
LTRPPATRSPGAQIIEFGDDGIRTTEWDKLQLVDHWRRFLAKPDFYLRYALDMD